MLTIAICDDDEAELQKIRAAAEDFVSRQCGVNAQIKEFSDSLEFLDSIEKNPCPELVLLDICMPYASGIEIAKKIREKSSAAKIIFLTTSKEYALDAFEVNAVHYLVKPFTQNQFDEAMERTIDLFTSNSKPKEITINGKGGSATIISISEITYIESIGYKRFVHTPKGEFSETQRTLTQFLKELEEMSMGQFISPYRGYIVNLAAVRTITAKAIQMKDGANILIKPGDFRILKEKLFRYTFR